MNGFQSRVYSVIDCYQAFVNRYNVSSAFIQSALRIYQRTRETRQVWQDALRS